MKRNWASELRAIADGRLLLNVRNGVTVSRSMLAMIADEIDAPRATVTPAEVGGHADAQTEAQAIVVQVVHEVNGGKPGGHQRAAGIVAAALAAKDAELAAERAALRLAADRADRAEAALADALKALEPFAEIAGEPWADENGWTNAACQNDRICDWFGPSAFRTARRAREGGNADG